MAALGQVLTLARTCAGCHVGAPPDPGQGIPAREVSHDLIAAGHPPLRFELVNYLNAMPPHWNTRAATERHGTGFTAKLWTVSQLVSAQAAVDVLNYRAKQTEAPSRKQTPWPEFAEYDCFACHHNLGQPSWRQRQERRLRPGALPWGTWYFPLIPLLDSRPSGDRGPDPSGL